MATGTVKRFDEKKGYGFITVPGRNKDLFFHFSELQMDGFKKVPEGATVEFVEKEGIKGPCACEVRVLS